ncbi:MAG TPA: glycosyltransferase family 2 protein [Candidatus Levybacteria bacterium]|nr:glycosyltransferase family 2 protein [Candidatus Levybacteria bacterium]
MKKIIYPSVSIVIATFNSSRTLELCLKKVNEQDYSKKDIEIITADGGSTDNTRSIAKKFGARIIKVDPKKQNAEYNKAIGLANSQNDIVLFLDHDNIIPHPNWLKNLILPLVIDRKLVGSEPARFHYDPSMTVLDRYIALIGGSDPVVYYLGKDSHLSYAAKTYNLLGKAKDMGSYYKVIYSKKGIPALGGNGAALVRKKLLKYTKCDPENFTHTDVVADLIRSGNNNYAIVKDTIIHLTNDKFFHFLKRRKYFIEKYQPENEYKRRYYIYDPHFDKKKLLLYILFSLTFIVPTWDALKGFYKVHDFAWFLHPIMCFVFLMLYAPPAFKGGVRQVIFGK